MQLRASNLVTSSYRCADPDATLIALDALDEVPAADALKVARIVGAMQRGKAFSPIIIAKTTAGFCVRDGKHRVQAARALGHSHVPVVFQTQ